MSPELGFALFLTLLWGPTALWLGYRALRGHRSRRSGSFNVASDTAPSPVPGPGVADCASVARILDLRGMPFGEPSRGETLLRLQDGHGDHGSTGAGRAAGQANGPRDGRRRRRAAGRSHEDDSARCHHGARCHHAARCQATAPGAKVSPVPAATARVATKAAVAKTTPVATMAPVATPQADPPASAAFMLDPEPAVAAARRDPSGGRPCLPVSRVQE